MSTINEEKSIKKKYGEKMWHYCRTTFPSILETNGKLYNLLINNFYPSHKLYDALEKSGQLYEFKDYIFSMLDVKEEVEVDYDSLRSPEELLSEAGYTLYECHTEDEIQAFKKYYAPGEELCTFRSDRLERCYVFFAVRKDALELKREDFRDPKRQDEYGTSVISIQFSRDDDHTLSIKNRYNHTVDNPDATFSNNLDNIVPGLTASFEKYYDLKQQYQQDIELEGFISIHNRLHRCLYEENGIYYCEDNIIDDNGFVIETYKDKSRYLFCGAIIFDKQKRKFFTYDKKLNEGLIDTFEGILDVEVETIEKGKRIIIKYDGYDAVMTLDDDGMIIGYDNPSIEVIGDYFLHTCERLQFLNIPNARVIGNNFVGENLLKTVSLLNVEEVGEAFMSELNNTIKSVDMPKLRAAGNYFCRSMRELESLNVPSLVTVPCYFLGARNKLKSLSLPSAEALEQSALAGCERLEDLYIPNVWRMGKSVLAFNNALKVLDAPSLKIFEEWLLYKNTVLESINAPLLTSYHLNDSSELVINAIESTRNKSL